MFGTKPKEDDKDTFVKRIRKTIEDKTCATSGFSVFEHTDDSALDDQEKTILANLKKAHEDWNARNPKVANRFE